MKKLLTIKHWQYMLMLLGPSFLIRFILGMSGLAYGYGGFMNVLFIALMGFYTYVFFGWFYALGKGLHEKLPPSVNLSFRWFRFFISVPVFLIIMMLVLGIIALTSSPLTSPPPREFLLLLIPCLLLSAISIFYMIHFVAKALKTVELKREAVPGDYIGEFFLIWIFIIGIWFIQPRVNKIFDASAHINDDFGDDRYTVKF